MVIVPPALFGGKEPPPGFGHRKDASILAVQPVFRIFWNTGHFRSKKAARRNIPVGRL
jgi:hypothetical protein